MKIKKIIITIVVAVTGCSSQSGWLNYSHPAALNMTPPPGSAQYKQGWLDGCNAGLTAVNNNMSMMFNAHKYVINANLWENNPSYKHAWKDAYYYCTYHMFSGMMNTF